MRTALPCVGVITNDGSERSGVGWAAPRGAVGATVVPSVGEAVGAAVGGCGVAVAGKKLGGGVARLMPGVPVAGGSGAVQAASHSSGSNSRLRPAWLLTFSNSPPLRHRRQSAR